MPNDLQWYCCIKKTSSSRKQILEFFSFVYTRNENIWDKIDKGLRLIDFEKFF